MSLRELDRTAEAASWLLEVAAADMDLGSADAAAAFRWLLTMCSTSMLAARSERQRRKARRDCPIQLVNVVKAGEPVVIRRRPGAVDVPARDALTAAFFGGGS